MASAATTQVRLVRCPKCQNVLLELPGLSVYMCGGCGAVLQAKNRKNGKTVSSGTLEKNTEKNQLHHDSDDVKSTSSVQIENHCDTKECSSILNAKEQIESPDCSIKPSGSWHFLNRVSSGGSGCSSYLSVKEKTESTGCSNEPSGRWKFLSGASSGDSLDLDSGKEQIECLDCSIKRSGSRNFLKEVASGDLSYHDSKEKPFEAGWNTIVDENDESQSPDGKLSSGGKSSSITAQRQSDENNPMKMSFASSKKQLLQSHGISHDESDHTRSIETVKASETIDNGNISWELSGIPKDISKSPTARSYHAYDGSVSPCDVQDDQVPEQPQYQPEKSWLKRQVVTDFASNEERPRRKDVLMDKKIHNNPEVQHHLRKLFSMSSGEKHGSAVMDGLKWEGSKIKAQERVGSPDSNDLHPTNNQMRSIRDEFWPGESFQRGSPTVYEKGSPSNYAHISSRMSECSSSKADYFEQMELLRLVEELRGQLSRSYNPRGMANGRFPVRGTQQEMQQSPYYSSGQLDPKIPHWNDANYHRDPHISFMARKNGFQNSELLQMHFSGHGTNFRNHVDCSSDRCCPEDWRYQTQLPPSSPHCNKVPCSRGHSGQMCYQPYSSSSATQQKYMDPCFSLQCCKTHSQDLGHMVHDVVQKKYYRNRHQPVKRHCHPIAGGAPFIICYRCHELLQLPEDFISQKRVLRLQCSACSQVLKFSLQNRTHIIPYNPNPVEPLYHGNDLPEGEPVSCSEDCGPSRSKSCSPEVDAPPFPILQGNADDKKKPSSSYSEAKLKRKNLKQSRNSSKTSIKASESTSASSNVAKPKSSSMERELAPQQPSSPLHWLMGYSSVSKIIR